MADRGAVKSMREKKGYSINMAGKSFNMKEV